MTTLPTWAVYAVSLGVPLLSFLAGLCGQWIARRGAVELETRSRREETMRTLRWAAELAVSVDDRMSDLGQAELKALLASNLLDRGEKLFIDAALDSMVAPALEELEEAEEAGEDVEAVELGPGEPIPPSAD